VREILWRAYLMAVAALFLIVGCLAFPLYVAYEAWRVVRKGSRRSG
jgi:hypothetical protein